MDFQTLENWHAAGAICGRSYADEMNKLAQIQLIDEVLEAPGVDKQAVLKTLLPGLRGLMGTPAAKALGIGALTAAGAAGGHVVTKKVEEKQQQEELAQIAPQVFRAGFIQGARQGFVQGAQRGYLAAQGQRSA